MTQPGPAPRKPTFSLGGVAGAPSRAVGVKAQEEQLRRARAELGLGPSRWRCSGASSSSGVWGGRGSAGAQPFLVCRTGSAFSAGLIVGGELTQYFSFCDIFHSS